MDSASLSIRFIDGTAFSLLMFIASAGALCVLCLPPSRLRTLAALATFTAVSIFTGTATPLPLGWVYLYFGAACALWVWNTFHLRAHRTGQAIALGVLVLSIAALISEHRATRPGNAPAYQSRPLIVLGDSLSSGLQQGETPWPVALSRKLETPIQNRARAGARMVDGLEQIESIALENAVVIVFLGGNDLLAMRPPEIYETQLSKLVKKLQIDGAEPILLAYPGLPFNGAYPRALRRVARETAVPVIPHTILSDVLAGPNNTTDGLHLSDKGHALLATKIAAWFKSSAE